MTPKEIAWLTRLAFGGDGCVNPRHVGLAGQTQRYFELGPFRGRLGSFLAAVRDASRRSRNMPGLAPAGHLLDLACGTGSVVHKDALAGREVTFGRITLENLRLGRSD